MSEERELLIEWCALLTGDSYLYFEKKDTNELKKIYKNLINQDNDES